MIKNVVQALLRLGMNRVYIILMAIVAVLTIWVDKTQSYQNFGSFEVYSPTLLARTLNFVSGFASVQISISLFLWTTSRISAINDPYDFYYNSKEPSAISLTIATVISLCTSIYFCDIYWFFISGIVALGLAYLVHYKLVL